MMSQLPLDLVRTLLAVVDEGTFDAAAGALHVTPSAVSQRVKALEQRVGRVLLIREKPVRPTESGEVIVRFARQLARLEHDAHAALGMTGTGETTRVSIAVNADSLATWFLPALTRVPEELRPCYELLREDEQHTARLLREGLVMAAVTSAPDAVAGCSVRPLGRMRYRPCAAPAFAERWLGFGSGTPLKELIADAPVVFFDRRDEFQDAFVRRLTRGRSAAPRRHYVPTSEGFVDAVAAGMGWGMVPAAQAGRLLDSGRLVDLAPERFVDAQLFWQQWKLDSPALTAVAEAVAAEAAEALGP
ncbi:MULTISPECIES: LysR family transcriptional regulator ArgP [Streptomyces]|uniref:LysR family transcriptional regulator ArgP n=1 Tax=Streptomyces caniscabiei TaxID=2746961 RepID=A0ABU4MT66_9ACTN|nr:MULTISPECIES: LysR family transcriptional regulator ArgP [Streptomyces]MBE4737453.1 LysR family transcriptional regulator ArgP [Streptomyces caniscabiei]MBE4756213.1 LysR family transcriptional regulator ArgP [Streptomyces caniscabiei]MBE4769770.1 LysR family transcriptional regulator ArgP [Streptomyces caniscabiei]MBE4787284.1 LysR family transcriptional regulator ArgP [Streptomyces caniscabiei]MBE4795311.1 LysR family transcriptional regulator ArgP [Streptomyces caniscabiei]